MQRFCLTLVLVSLFGVAALAAPQSQKQEDKKKKDEPAPVIVRAQLPRGWGKLGLTTKQKRDVYATRAKYAAKRQALQEQLRKLTEEEMQECEKILNDAQKKLLKERGNK
ncbi:MAG TPA: hypothetical protein VMG10_15030 [Gemmataceae bacterium]|nr:hypothetical protein [Gemmataceae bacterium]